MSDPAAVPNPSTNSSPGRAAGAPVDPVRARRAQIAKWTQMANRVGYIFMALAIVLFVLAFALGFNATMSALIIACLVAGSILLAPAIVLGYAVKAAERDDRERGF
jgi:hypothetical protein